MKYPFIVYDKNTGDFLRSGRCSRESDIWLQAQSPNEAVMSSDQDAVQVVEVDIAPLKQSAKKQLLQSIDEHLPYLSTQQVMRYNLKRAEAESGGGKILAAEAAIRGITMEEMINLVNAAIIASEELVALIEAKRIEAQIAIDNATNVKQIADAYNIDWDAIISAYIADSA